jgi:hypothetical protein
LDLAVVCFGFAILSVHARNRNSQGVDILDSKSIFVFVFIFKKNLKFFIFLILNHADIKNNFLKIKKINTFLNKKYFKNNRYYNTK